MKNYGPGKANSLGKRQNKYTDTQMSLEISSSGKDPKDGTYKNIKMKHFSLEQLKKEFRP